MREQFEEYIQYLPEVNQHALRSFDWATVILNVGKKNGLYIDQLEDLQIETMLVLTGQVSAEDYPNELMNRLALSPAQAEKIIFDINQQVFTPIHDYILDQENKEIKVPTEITAPQPISFGSPLEQAGIYPTVDDAPTPTPEVSLSRVGGVRTLGTSIPETRPVQFSPQVKTTSLEQAPMPLSMEKLRRLHQQRQHVIDTTLDKAA